MGVRGYLLQSLSRHWGRHVAPSRGRCFEPLSCLLDLVAVVAQRPLALLHQGAQWGIDQGQRVVPTHAVRAARARAGDGGLPPRATFCPAQLSVLEDLHTATQAGASGGGRESSGEHFQSAG